MTTTLNVAEQELSKQINDFWSSSVTATSTNARITDTALQDQPADWLTDQTFLQMQTLNAAADTSERTIATLNTVTGFVTWNRALTGNTINADTYRVHRLFSASEKRRALINACKMSFPHLHEDIRNESKTTGDWLIDGDLEIWSSSSALNFWTTNAVTLAQTTTNGYVPRGSYSAKLSTAIGDIYQDQTKNPDLMELAGASVTFKGKLRCDATNCAMLQIKDGTTTTNSDYAPNTNDWPENNDHIEVTATIAGSPTEVTFKVIHANASATTYVDDLRVLGSKRDKIYIGDLGLQKNQPHKISYSSDGNIYNEPWITLRDYKVDEKTGWLYLSGMPNDYRLRIEGIGYLDFKASGVSSNAWTATVNIDSPQLEVLIAQAAIYLCNQKILPAETTGVNKQWLEARNTWGIELEERKANFGMDTPQVITQWSN